MAQMTCDTHIHEHCRERDAAQRITAAGAAAIAELEGALADERTRRAEADERAAAALSYMHDTSAHARETEG